MTIYDAIKSFGDRRSTGLPVTCVVNGKGMFYKFSTWKVGIPHPCPIDISFDDGNRIVRYTPTGKMMDCNFDPIKIFADGYNVHRKKTLWPCLAIDHFDTQSDCAAAIRKQNFSTVESDNNIFNIPIDVWNIVSHGDEKTYPPRMSDMKIMLFIYQDGAGKLAYTQEIERYNSWPGTFMDMPEQYLSITYTDLLNGRPSRSIVYAWRFISNDEFNKHTYII
ncbi:hypothetical protein [Microcystis phage Mel-JY01]